MFIAIILIVAICSPFYNRKSAGTSVQQLEFSTEAFMSLEVRLPADIFYEAAETYKVKILGEPYQLTKIESVVECGKLHIRSMRYRPFRSQPRISVFVSAPDIISLGVDSEGSITIRERSRQVLHK